MTHGNRRGTKTEDKQVKNSVISRSAKHYLHIYNVSI